MKKTWLIVAFALVGGYAFLQIALQDPQSRPRPARARLGQQVRQTLKARKARPPRVQGRRCC